jgi:hypothetical protein
MKVETDEEGVYDDGSKRFERVEVDEFQIRRPEKGRAGRKKRRELHVHNKRGCRITQYDSDEEKVENKEDSDNSQFCTPFLTKCSPEKHPLVSRKIVKHFDETGCDIVGLERTLETRRWVTKNGSYLHPQERQADQENEGRVYDDTEEQRSTGRKVNIQSSGRLEYTKRLSFDSERASTSGREPEEEEKRLNFFDGLSYDEGLLINSSYEDINRLSGDQTNEYRRIVEKLMRNTGILFAGEIDNNQWHHLKKKVIPDFRRQTTPRPPQYSANGHYEGR